MLDINQVLHSFKDIKVLVVGDVMVDHYIFGSVDRISPEAPVPIITVDNQKYEAGGAANVALNIHALGATPILCSVIGNDNMANLLVHQLESIGIDKSHLIISNHRKTTSKKRVLAQGQQLLRIDEEDTFRLNDREELEFLERVKHILNTTSIDAIIFQDYNKGLLYDRTIQTILTWAVEKNILTAVDPKVDNFFEYTGVTLFKPNFKEIQLQFPNVIKSKSSLQTINEQLHKRLNNRETIITLSDKGLFYANNSVDMMIPTFPRIISDVCGAGDTVISIASLGLVVDIDRENLSLLCNLAGGQVCERVGVTPVNANQLVDDFHQYYRSINKE